MIQRRKVRRNTPLVRWARSLILALLATTLVSGSGMLRGQDDRELATLAEKWNITDPITNVTTNTFNFEYRVSDFILNPMIFDSVWDKDCVEGDRVDSSILESTITYDDFVPGSGDKQRSVWVAVTFDPETISSSEIYREKTKNGQTVGVIEWCHRFSLRTMQTGLMREPMEVNYIETITTLDIDLTDGFQVGGIQVAPKATLVKTSFSKYEVEACFCDGTQCTTGGFGGGQGDVAQVCVRPEFTAFEQGFRMRRIDEFTWRRDYGGIIGEIRQDAVVGAKAAPNLLSDLFCTSGDPVCSFLTILRADFYKTPGIVTGDGVATLQFGSEVIDSRRRLGDRYLEEEDGEGLAVFDVSMEARPRANPFDYSASTRPSSTISLGAMTLLALALGLL